MTGKHCKKVRNDEGFWEQVEQYMGSKTTVSFSHGICPDCMEVHWPQVMRLRANKG